MGEKREIGTCTVEIRVVQGRCLSVRLAWGAMDSLGGGPHQKLWEVNWSLCRSAWLKSPDKEIPILHSLALWPTLAPVFARPHGLSGHMAHSHVDSTAPARCWAGLDFTVEQKPWAVAFTLALLKTRLDFPMASHIGVRHWKPRGLLSPH